MFHNHDQLFKGKSTKSFNDQEFSSKKYQYLYLYRQYWPCNYLVLDRYQNLQYRPPLVIATPSSMHDATDDVPYSLTLLSLVAASLNICQSEPSKQSLGQTCKTF